MSPIPEVPKSQPAKGLSSGNGLGLCAAWGARLEEILAEHRRSYDANSGFGLRGLGVSGLQGFRAIQLRSLSLGLNPKPVLSNYLASVSREWKNGSNSSYNCTPFLHSLLTEGIIKKLKPWTLKLQSPDIASSSFFFCSESFSTCRALRRVLHTELLAGFRILSFQFRRVFRCC